MIAYIRGELFEKTPEFAVVVCSGVGFKLGITLRTFYALPAVGEQVELLVSTYVRESAIELYGFVDALEREVFELIADVSGFGPKHARNILSGIEPGDLVDAVLAGDVARLVAIPGVGKKRAQQLIFQLKDKLGSKGEADLGVIDQRFSDAVTALENLGYTRAEAEAAVSKARNEASGELSLEDLIKEALRILGASKGERHGKES